MSQNILGNNYFYINLNVNKHFPKKPNVSKMIQNYLILLILFIYLFVIQWIEIRHSPAYLTWISNWEIFCDPDRDFFFSRLVWCLWLRKRCERCDSSALQPSQGKLEFCCLLEEPVRDLIQVTVIRRVSGNAGTAGFQTGLTSFSTGGKQDWMDELVLCLQKVISFLLHSGCCWEYTKDSGSWIIYQTQPH